MREQTPRAHGLTESAPSTGFGFDKIKATVIISS